MVEGRHTHTHTDINTDARRTEQSTRIKGLIGSSRKNGGVVAREVSVQSLKLLIAF